ncbi:MAG: hypothetical protein IT371_00860 [Deltaproteobacteria bacterium]|nr:hypothetical protein [Deltaproteobacteria bacterium]
MATRATSAVLWSLVLLSSVSAGWAAKGKALSQVTGRALRLAGSYATRAIRENYSGGFQLKLARQADGKYRVSSFVPHSWLSSQIISFDPEGEYLDGAGRDAHPPQASDARGKHALLSAAFQLVKAARQLGVTEATLNAQEQSGRYLIAIQYAGNTLLETFDGVARRLDGRHVSAEGVRTFDAVWRAPVRGSVTELRDPRQLPEGLRAIHEHPRALRVQLGSRRAFVVFDARGQGGGVTVQPAQGGRSTWTSGRFERLSLDGRYLLVSDEVRGSQLQLSNGGHDLQYRAGRKPRFLWRVDLTTGLAAREGNFDPAIARVEEQALAEYRRTHPIDQKRWDADLQRHRDESAARHARSLYR